MALEVSLFQVSRMSWDVTATSPSGLRDRKSNTQPTRPRVGPSCGQVRSPISDRSCLPSRTSRPRRDQSRSKGRPRTDVERMCDAWQFASRRKSFPAERTYLQTIARNPAQKNDSPRLRRRQPRLSSTFSANRTRMLRLTVGHGPALPSRESTSVALSQKSTTAPRLQVPCPDAKHFAWRIL